MWNPPTKKQLEKIPKLYSTDGEKDKKVYMKFFLGGWTWYACEFDGKDTFFGLVLSPMEPKGEMGYFSLSELKNVKQGYMQVDRDLYEVTVYSPKLLSQLIK
jgi:hypothetical protein